MEATFISWLVEQIGDWATPIVAASVGAFLYTRRQRAANRHVLHALWEESRLINHDCLQWKQGFDRDGLLKKIETEEKFRPYSINYKSSKQAIEKLMSDMPGIAPELVRAGMHYHYDDANAAATIATINAQLWHEYSTVQRGYLIDDADRAMQTLCDSSRVFHELLSQELKIPQDVDVFEQTVPASLRI